MKRRSSGQVLIGAATLMLVILLTMAASLPVINTSIDPSSKVYNLALYAVKSAVDDLITRMSAYQCATALWYADARHKNIDFTGHAKEIENRIKNSLTQTASKSSYNLELKSISVAIPVAKIVISSTVWHGNPKSASAGEVEISMAVHVDVSFEYRIKNSGANFQKYTAWYEEYLTIEGKGEYKKKVPWQGLPWVEFGLSFVPIVGALVGNIEGVTFKLPTRVTHYKAVFDNQRIFAGVESDDLTKSLGLAMLKPRDKIEFYSETKNKNFYKTIEWVEYNKIDWGAIAVGIAIDLIPWGKVVGTAAKAVKALKQDITNDSPEALYIGIGPIGGESGDILRRIWKKEVEENMEKVKKIDTESGTTDHFGYPKFGTDTVDEVLGSVDQEGQRQMAFKTIKQLLDERKKLEKSFAESWLQALGGGANDYLKLIDEYSKKLGMKIDGIELYQSTAGGGKIMAYFANRNPLVWVGVPLHNGNSLFGVCVWLIGAYYPGDA
jgi:hypothetical protein